jgi:hypothetical protein
MLMTCVLTGPVNYTYPVLVSPSSVSGRLIAISHQDKGPTVILSNV